MTAPCRACGLTPTPRGGRCAECEKKRRKAWKQAARMKKAAQIGAKPAKTIPATPKPAKPARKTHSASVASAELLPGVEMVLRRVYERAGEAERAELRVLNPDIDFEKG